MRKIIVLLLMLSISITVFVSGVFADDSARDPVLRIHVRLSDRMFRISRYYRLHDNPLVTYALKPVLYVDGNPVHGLVYCDYNSSNHSFCFYSASGGSCDFSELTAFLESDRGKDTCISHVKDNSIYMKRSIRSMSFSKATSGIKIGDVSNHSDTLFVPVIPDAAIGPYRKPLRKKSIKKLFSVPMTMSLRDDTVCRRVFSGRRANRSFLES